MAASTTQQLRSEHSILRKAWADEQAAAKAARQRGDTGGEWRHLERAHILSQPMPVPHLRTHAAMLATAMRRRDVREAAGQLLRLLLAAPGSLTGRYPVGNTGGANVSAFRPMPIPDDLARFFDQRPAAAPAAAATEGDFSQDPTGLPACTPSEVVALSDGDVHRLRIAAVANQVGDHRVRMLAYNGSVPGPTLRVRQGTEITVEVTNDADHETTVHWHGLRIDNAYDGVPDQTQAPIPVGGRFTYRLRFPDDGLYWYHPHVREDYGLEMGLYGNLLVDPAGDDWNPVNREAVVALDDVLIEDGKIAPFHVGGLTHTAMGRFGNVLLAAGSTHLRLDARAGEVVRFFFTDTANTRIFNVAIPDARMKLIGGDSGRYEHDQWVDEVLLAPSERAIVDVLFPTGAEYRLEHRTPDHTYVLGTVTVSEEPTDVSFAAEFDVLRTDQDLVRERGRLAADRARPPDKTLVFDSKMPILYGDDAATTPGAFYTCPMHPEVVSAEPGSCPRCGMKLIAATAETTASGDRGASEHDHQHGEVHGHGHDGGDGLEWEDLMPEINARTDATNMIWKLVDADTGKENHAIDWAFRVGDRVKIRLVNTMDSDHPMHHPFHIHGAGRFLVLERGGVAEANLVWKDTVLIRAGETVDIVLDVTNPGLWMAHCHIAEHNQNGMMFSFPVTAA